MPGPRGSVALAESERSMRQAMAVFQKFAIAAALGVSCVAGEAQAPAAAPRVVGSVKTTGEHALTVTGVKGDVAVDVTDAAKVMELAPGSTNLSTATPTTLASISVGDRVLVSGTAGDDPAALHATRVVVMRSADISKSHAADEEAWQRGGGGLVKSVDAATGNIILVSGTTSLTVKTTSSTKFSRYSGDSVRFADATASKLSDVQPGDQLRVRGKHADDGSIAADQIVTGSFRNFSGILTAVDGTAGTVTLRDLATKKMVTVKVSPNSDLRRLPPQAAARFAARATGANVGPAGTSPGSSGASASGPGGNARAGMDLSQMLSRLPTETLGSLKVGDAVMIVATQPAPDASQATAVTLLAGVEPILQASPKGEMTLTPWSVGGGSPEGGGGGGQ